MSNSDTVPKTKSWTVESYILADWLIFLMMFADGWYLINELRIN